MHACFKKSKNIPGYSVMINMQVKLQEIYNFELMTTKVFLGLFLLGVKLAGWEAKQKFGGHKRARITEISGSIFRLTVIPFQSIPRNPRIYSPCQVCHTQVSPQAKFRSRSNPNCKGEGTLYTSAGKNPASWPPGGQLN